MIDQVYERVTVHFKHKLYQGTDTRRAQPHLLERCGLHVQNKDFFKNGNTTGIFVKYLHTVSWRNNSTVTQFRIQIALESHWRINSGEVGFCAKASDPIHKRWSCAQHPGKTSALKLFSVLKWNVENSGVEWSLNKLTELLTVTSCTKVC